jgi:hypothetical protein
LPEQHRRIANVGPCERSLQRLGHFEPDRGHDDAFRRAPRRRLDGTVKPSDVLTVLRTPTTVTSNRVEQTPRASVIVAASPFDGSPVSSWAGARFRWFFRAAMDATCINIKGERYQGLTDNSRGFAGRRRT